MTDVDRPQPSSFPAAGPSRTGLVVFAATAALALGGTAAVVAVMRFVEPEAFAFAPRLLDRTLGAAAAMATFAAGACGVAAAWLAVRSRRRAACALLLSASVAGAGALVVRAFETPSAQRNAGFVEAKAASGGGGAAAGSPAAAPHHQADPAHGKNVYYGTCAACHGPELTGLRGQGANLRDSEFVKSKSDAELLAFVKIGRQPFDPESKLHLAMPAKGGNPALREADLIDAIAFVREAQKSAPAAAVAVAGKTGPAGLAKAAAPAAALPSGDQPMTLEGRLWLPHSVISPANAGPGEVDRASVALQRPGAWARSTTTLHAFFRLLLFAQALQAFYLLAGVALGVVAVVGVARKSMKPEAVVLVAGYWVVVAATSLLIVPLFYLPS